MPDWYVAVDQRTNRVSFPSLERGQQLLREGFRIEATLHLGDELKLRLNQVEGSHPP